MATASEQARFYTSFRWPGAARVYVVGDVELSSAQALGDRLLTLPTDFDLVVLDVDLTETTFLDCAGVSALLRARHAAAAAGCLLYITNPRPIVRRVLDLTGVLDFFTAPRRQQISPPRSGHQQATSITLSVAEPAMLAAA